MRGLAAEMRFGVCRFCKSAQGSCAEPRGDDVQATTSTLECPPLERVLRAVFLRVAPKTSWGGRCARNGPLRWEAEDARADAAREETNRIFFEMLESFELVCAIPSAKKPGPARMKLFPNLQEHLARDFMLRHEFAHDGNSTTVLDPREIRELETTAILLCQMTGYLDRYEAPAWQRKPNCSGTPVDRRPDRRRLGAC